MKKSLAVAIVLMMVFTFGIYGIHAQQADTTKDHGKMMMGTDCPMMAKAGGTKCAVGTDGKCPMTPNQCPMASHHGTQGTDNSGHVH